MSSDSDTMDKAGAERLRFAIENYWLKRGHAVRVEVQSLGFYQSVRGQCWVVRSNLVDGRPRPKPSRETYHGASL